MRLFGFDLFPRKVPEHVEAAEAAVLAVDEAIADGKAAVADYKVAVNGDRRISAQYALAEPERRKAAR